MKTSDIKIMLTCVRGSGYGDWEEEYAIKAYFYPFCSALLTTEQWESVIDTDDSRIRKGKESTVIGWLRDGLAAVIAELNLPDGHYPSVIVYGMLKHDHKPLDLVFNSDSKGNVTVSEQVAYKVTPKRVVGRQLVS